MLGISLMLALCTWVVSGAPKLRGDEKSALSSCRAGWGATKTLWTGKSDDWCGGYEAGITAQSWQAPNPCKNKNPACSMRCEVWNASTYVTALSLPGMQLRGKFCDSLATLRRLQTINVANNFLTGSLPTTMGTNRARTTGLTQLSQIYIGANNISGEIPQSFAYLPLTVMAISPNLKLCGTEWLGSIGTPPGGSAQLFYAIMAGAGGINATSLGIDCALVNIVVGDHTSFGQLVWSAGVLGAIVVLSAWCLHN